MPPCLAPPFGNHPQLLGRQRCRNVANTSRQCQPPPPSANSAVGVGHSPAPPLVAAPTPTLGGHVIPVRPARCVYSSLTTGGARGEPGETRGRPSCRWAATPQRFKPAPPGTLCTVQEKPAWRHSQRKESPGRVSPEQASPPFRLTLTLPCFLSRTRKGRHIPTGNYARCHLGTPAAALYQGEEPNQAVVPRRRTQLPPRPAV